jgi:hypothetical protein
MKANLTQNKKNCKASQKPKKIGTHFILPKATKPIQNTDRQNLAASSIY